MMTLRLYAMAALVLLTAERLSAESHLSNEFVSAQPRVQLYMAYAQFKMANYHQAEAMWRYVNGPGKAEALFNLAILYEQGLGVEVDLAQAMTLYTQAAQAGSRASAYQLGLIYLHNKALQNRQQAEHWLTIAALDGDEDAAALLKQFDNTELTDDPLVNIRGLIIQGDTDQAIAKLQQLTQTIPPNYKALTRLAWLYETGIGVERDIEHAGQLFRQAAEAGVAEAQYALAVMLQTGIGQGLDLKQAHYWLELAAAQHYPQALQQLQAKD